MNDVHRRLIPRPRRPTPLAGVSDRASAAQLVQLLPSHPPTEASASASPASISFTTRENDTPLSLSRLHGHSSFDNLSDTAIPTGAGVLGARIRLPWASSIDLSGSGEPPSSARSRRGHVAVARCIHLGGGQRSAPRSVWGLDRPISSTGCSAFTPRLDNNGGPYGSTYTSATVHRRS